jgi:hypothetical protein
MTDPDILTMIVIFAGAVIIAWLLNRADRNH